MQTSSVSARVLAAPRPGHAQLSGLSRARVPACSVRRGCVTLAAASAPAQPAIKVCGVTTPDEARQAAKAGATMIGLILWPKSKRSVDLANAKEIAAATKEAGAVPVGVFVDEDTDQIVAALKATGINVAQLHGDGARLALAKLPMEYKAIWVVNADESGKIVTKMPADVNEPKENPMAGPNGWKKAIDWMSSGRRVVDWILVDGIQAGSGKKYDYSKLKIAKGASRKGWILAGGLDPESVSEALKVTHPDGVDVSTGVTFPDGIKKNPARVEAFVKAAKEGLAARSAAAK